MSETPRPCSMNAHRKILLALFDLVLPVRTGYYLAARTRPRPVSFDRMLRAVGLDDTPLKSLAVLGFAPTGINAVVTAKLHDLNVHVATAAFVLTTGAYILVVFPIILTVFAVVGWA